VAAADAIAVAKTAVTASVNPFEDMLSPSGILVSFGHADMRNSHWSCATPRASSPDRS
jgi:hypothetical protein